MKSKRPWKKYARISRIETNGGDVRYRVQTTTAISGDGDPHGFQSESLKEAEAAINSWWSIWWPKQVKSVRRV